MIWTLFLVAACTGQGCREDSSSISDTNAAPRDAARAEEALQAIEVWLGKGDASKARTIAERLVEVDPDSPDAREAHAITLVAVAAETAAGGDEETAKSLRSRALSRYEEAIELSASTPRPDMLHASGIIAESLGLQQRALELYTDASEGAPDNASHAIYAGNVLIKMERHADAESWFDKAVTIDPAEPWGWAGRAVVFRQQARFEEALNSIRQARRAAGGRGTRNDLVFRVSEARILRESGRAEASARLLFALDAQTRANSAAVTEELHLACELIGEHARSAQVWAEFHAAHPDDGEALFMVAESWLRAERPEEAASWYRLAEDLGLPEELIDRMKRKAREAVARDRSGQ